MGALPWGLQVRGLVRAGPGGSECGQHSGSPRHEWRVPSHRSRQSAVPSTRQADRRVSIYLRALVPGAVLRLLQATAQHW